MVVSGADVAAVVAEGGVAMTGVVFTLIALAVFGACLMLLDFVLEARDRRRRERQRRRRVERARGGES